MLRLLALSSRRSCLLLAKRGAHSRIILKPGFLGNSHRKMAQPAEQHVRPSPDHEAEPDSKRPRLDLEGGDKKDTAEPIEVEQSAAESKGKGKKSKRLARKDKKKKHVLPDPYTNENIVYHDVIALMGQDAVSAAEEQGTDWTPPFENKTELELVVSELASTGESLSIAPAPYPPWIIVTPFGLPGETIRARVYRHGRLYSYADMLEVVKPNLEMRDDSRVQCKYFGKCAGCQYQMLSYETQLDLKRNVIVKAYQNFSDLPSSSVPTILPTIGSPLQYGYRTKITPHFDAPGRTLKKRGPESYDGSTKPDWFNVGFNVIGTRHTMDIEECPIATPVLNQALGPIRENIFKKLNTYKNGVSLLLRESLEIPPASATQDASTQTTADDLSSEFEKKICITDHKGTVRERVGDKLFEYTAGSFFQNNNSVLVPLTSYVRDAVFPVDAPPNSRPTHLVDAYCGSGLFSIMLSPHFDKVRGIELSADSIKSAKVNAQLNGIAEEKCSFMEGDAAKIFDTVAAFPRDRTVLIIDPPRKGSDEKFIDQLIRFGCATVAYVSCNVHTQARDVGMILRKSAEAMQGKKYVVESIRGFDLFPQTAHVESVAILRLVDA